MTAWTLTCRCWNLRTVSVPRIWQSGTEPYRAKRPEGAKKKQVEIQELLGVALGAIGLSYDDFCRLTPEEFEEVYKAFRERSDAEYKDEWVRMRMLATIVIQPHLKRKMTPEKLLPLPWDNVGKKARRDDAPRTTPEEDLKRFEKLLKRVGTNDHH